MTNEKKIPEKCRQCGEALQMGYPSGRDELLGQPRDVKVWRCGPSCTVYSRDGDALAVGR